MRSSTHTLLRAALVTVTGLCLSGCITARMQDSREGVTGIADGESVVIMARSYHLGNETEAKYITCVEDALARPPDVTAGAVALDEGDHGVVRDFQGIVRIDLDFFALCRHVDVCIRHGSVCSLKVNGVVNHTQKKPLQQAGAFVLHSLRCRPVDL